MMRLRRPLALLAAARWWVMAVLLLLVPAARTAAQKPPDPPAPPWKEFVKTKGHDNEIPVQWVATPEGRFAHDIVLPATIPKTVPFDFKQAKLRALQPGSKSVARQYWEHLCRTEAGSFILKPVENVDGFFFMRPVGGANEQENNDRWKLEAPGMQASWPPFFDPIDVARMFIDPPSATYEWIELAKRDGGVLRMSRGVSGTSAAALERVAISKAIYGIAWRGTPRQNDRVLTIAGVEWIALRLDSGEVLGVLRDFYLTGLTVNRPDGIYWLNAARCPSARREFAGASEMRETGVWAPMVLRPTVYPGVLKFVDEYKRGVK